jgi:hypothetical protein
MSAERIFREIRIVSLWLLLPILASFASSCSNTTPSGTSSGINSAQWVKVKKQPPTWYPRGIPADFSTDHKDGEWIDTEDEVGTRFFIPLRGLPPDRRNALLSEALAARTSEKSQRIHDEETKRKFGSAAIYLLVAPILAFGGAGL